MAYAVVVSLKQTLESLLDPSRSRLEIPDSEIREIYNDLCYLKSFFDKMKSLKDSNSMEELEKEIKDVLQTTRDLIECHLSDVLVHPGSEISTAELAEAKARFGSLINLFKAKEDFLTGGQQMPAVAPDVPISSSFGSGRNNRTVGLEDEVIGVKQLIFRGGSSRRVISITGIAGIGKTALAAKLFEDPDIIYKFPTRVFMSVGLEYELEELLLSLLRQMLADELKEGTVDELGQQLFKYLYGGKYLVVVDDIRNIRAWSELQQFLPDNNKLSAIILTTRTTAVARGACSKQNIQQKRFLTITESWELLHEISFPGTDRCPPKLEKVGKKIARKLLGVPLAVVEIGQLLSNSPATVENWKAVDPDVSQLIPKILKPSYAELPHHLKACFIYLGVFPPNCNISTSQLFKLWAAEGFINVVRDENERLEEKAEEYLEDLVSKCLVEVRERSSRGGIKSCRVSLPLHYLCVREAREEKLFHVVKAGNGNVRPPGIEEQRRLGVHNSILLGFKHVRNLMRSVTDARSLLCVGSQQRPLQLYLEFRRLKVLHALSIRFWEFPNAVARLVGLKYLAITCRGELPSSISRLWNLEILIINRISLVHSVVVLPLEVWKLRKLRHLYCMGLDVPDPGDAETEEDSLFLDKLLTLSGVSAGSCTAGILSRMPQLIKIGIRLESTHHHAVEKLFADDDTVFSRLHSLESFKCVFADLGCRTPKAASYLIDFPPSLVKLTLGGWGFSWDLITGIAQLPNLQVLKLRSSAFCGPKWTPVEGEFLRLKYLLLEDLDVVYMKVESTHFPVLEQLLIKHCYKLREFPLRFVEIPTLNVIEVEDCNSIVHESARVIQMELGTKRLKVVITSSWDHW